jgi:hypothetical protein
MVGATHRRHYELWLIPSATPPELDKVELRRSQLAHNPARRYLIRADGAVLAVALSV